MEGTDPEATGRGGREATCDGYSLARKTDRFLIACSALRDKQVIAVLERLTPKPEMRLLNPLAVSIQDNLKLTLRLYNFSRREVIGAQRRVLKSAKRHYKLDGSRGYLDFVAYRAGLSVLSLSLSLFRSGM